MFTFSRRLIYALSNKVRKINKRSNTRGSNEKIIFNFSKPVFRQGNNKPHFDIKSESSYNSYLSDSSLQIGIKNTNCIAWTDIPRIEFLDHVIESKFRIDTLGGYAAAGIIFRIMSDDTYYLALVSSKGYLRFDAVKDNSPKTLIAWTEIPDFDAANISLDIITYGTYIIFIVNNKWTAEVSDNSIAFGRLGFALASYEEKQNNEHEAEDKKSKNSEENIDEFADNTAQKNEYVCKAYLDYLSIDTRLNSIENSFKKWTDEININADSRLRLAETFAVMNEYSKALEQIEKAWKRRDAAFTSATADYTKVRTRRELLLAARMSSCLEQYSEAEEYLNAIINQWPDSAESKIACEEQLKILTELKKFTELNDFILKHQSELNKDTDYYTLLARSYWELKQYKKSAGAWDKAFKISGKNETKTENGVYAANAASAYELANKKEKALEKYITAAKIFLNQDNIPEMAAITPKLLLLGENNWEARALAGKWAFSIEDYDKCVKEFDAAEKIRCSIKPQPPADPALYYLWGLTHYINKNKKSAIRMIQKAVKLAPDYELFRAKLDEIKSAKNA